MTHLNRILIFILLLGICTSAAYAEDPATGPAMDPAMMEKMKAFSSPTDAHKVLDAFVGDWTYSGKFWMTPDAQPQDMTGTAEHTMIFGGRFLQQRFEGPWMGEMFQGLGYTGYDNIKQEYNTIWLDSVSTGLMIASGQYDAVTKTLSQAGTMSCPMTGEKDRQSRSEWKAVDSDHNTYTSYMNDENGKEFKSMEITYSRTL